MPGCYPRVFAVDKAFFSKIGISLLYRYNTQTAVGDAAATLQYQHPHTVIGRLAWVKISPGRPGDTWIPPPGFHSWNVHNCHFGTWYRNCAAPEGFAARRREESWNHVQTTPGNNRKDMEAVPETEG